MPRLLLLTASLLSSAMASDLSVLQGLTLPPGTCQAILVIAPSPDSSAAILQRWERTSQDSPWQPAAPPHPVTLGRTGLAWGLGLHATPEGSPLKAEGDGKAPAGIFSLGTAFGYSIHPVPGSRWPYRPATIHDFFVDDPASPDYNRWVNSPGQPPEARWASFERMRRPDDLYRRGLVVEHNSSPPLPSRGSAIFLHLWKGPGQPTAGCTAMAENHLRDLLLWLRPGAHPLLIQTTPSFLPFLTLRPPP